MVGCGVGGRRSGKLGCHFRRKAFWRGEWGCQTQAMKNEHYLGERSMRFIDHRRNSHEGLSAFSRIEFDAANRSLGCVGDLPSTKQIAAYRGITPTMLCYSTGCVESKERASRAGPTTVRSHSQLSKEVCLT